MPNSRVRALTENASTPATPTTAISSAMPDNARRHRLSVYREDRIGPREVPVHRVAVREQPLCQALADDGHRFGSATVIVGEFAARDERDAEHGEEARRHHAHPPARILFPV